MAQAEQIRSIILQNHESTWIVNQKFFKIKYINESKHSNIAWNWRLSQKSGKLSLVPPAHVQRLIKIFPIGTKRSDCWRLNQGSSSKLLSMSNRRHMCGQWLCSSHHGEVIFLGLGIITLPLRAWCVRASPEKSLDFIVTSVHIHMFGVWFHKALEAKHIWERG